MHLDKLTFLTLVYEARLRGRERALSEYWPTKRNIGFLRHRRNAHQFHFMLEHNDIPALITLQKDLASALADGLIRKIPRKKRTNQLGQKFFITKRGIRMIRDMKMLDAL